MCGDPCPKNDMCNDLVVARLTRTDIDMMERAGRRGVIYVHPSEEMDDA